MDCADSVRTDQLNCAVSIARQPTSKTPNEVLELGLSSEKTLWTFIVRNFPREYADVGCCVYSGGVDYFLWIELSPKAYNEIIEKYGLKPRVI